MAQAAKKGTAQSIINKEVLGAGIDYSKPKDGISKAKIRTDEVGNVPGIIEHWDYDIELRLKELNANTGLSFMKRAMGVLGKQETSVKTTGEELTTHYPDKRCLAFVANLKSDPQDAFTRLQLVSVVGSGGRDLSLEAYRALMLQAVVACSLGKVSTQWLKIAARSQNQYFLQLYNKCKDDQEKLNKSISGMDVTKKEDNDIRVSLQKRLQNVRKNMKILRLYQMHASKGSKDGSGGDCMVSDVEIKNFSNLKNDEEKKQLAKKLVTVMSSLRYVLLLHPAGHALLDKMISEDKNNPIGYFLKGRLYMSAMVFFVSLYEGGARSGRVKQLIQDRFKETYHQYGLAANKVGTQPKVGTEYTILIEHAQAIYYFYVTAKNTLEISLPKEWLRTALDKANKSLEYAVGSGKVEGLQAKLREAMKNEGCK
ncbi:MAG: hypothetical protein HQM14_17915 [SAR324 cluster bacterium]|nr:hypothetical protein [SAR324 cluster bacterium]